MIVDKGSSLSMMLL